MNDRDVNTILNIEVAIRLRQKALIGILERNESVSIAKVEAEFKRTPRLVRDKEFEKLQRFGREYAGLSTA